MDAIFYAPAPENIIEQARRAQDRHNNAIRMNTFLYEFIRAHMRHLQTLSWIHGTATPFDQEMFHPDLVHAISQGCNAVRVLAAREEMAREKAAASFRQFVRDHPESFEEFYRLLDGKEETEVRKAGIDPRKVQEQLRENPSITLPLYEQIINNPNNNEHEENKPG